MADGNYEDRTGGAAHTDRRGDSGKGYSRGHGGRDGGYRSDRRDREGSGRGYGRRDEDRRRDRSDRPPRREGGYRSDRRDSGRDSNSREGGYREDRSDRPPRREGGYRSDRRDGGYRRDSDRRDREGSDRGYGRRDGGYRGDRSDRPPRREGGYRSDRRDSGFRGDRRDGYGGPRRDRDEAPARWEDADTPMKVTIPSDPQKMLFKGIDCEVNGRKDLAMVLYLHGAAAGSGGCEENAEKILRGMQPFERTGFREKIAELCSEDALIEFDYVRLKLDPTSNRELIDSASSEGNSLAIYCRIRMDEIDPEDPIIDVFAKDADAHPDRIAKGLDRLRRRHGSEKAAGILKKVEHRRQERQTINETFAKAMRNDAKALARLEKLADDFPEAGFLAGYIESDDPEAYLRENMDGNRDLIIAVSSNLRLDTPFGTYLSAMKAKNEGDDWIPAMIAAARAGSPEAEAELGSAKSRGDVARALAEIRLEKGDVAALARMYDGEDAEFLDRYCDGDAEKMLEVGRTLGGDRELDWLKRCCRNGEEECRDAVVQMASDESRWSKRLVYTLHDVGADMDAAKLYFAMEGDPTLPSPKWLAKVCGEDEVKEYVRSVFEGKGDLEGFEAIFADDGYEDRKRSGPRRGGPSGQGRGKPRGGYRR